MKNKIIEKSYELFMEKGYEKVSVNDIIGAANISKGGFYHYFSSKEDLLEEIALLYIKDRFSLIDSIDIKKANKLSDVINLYYHKVLTKKKDDILKKITMEEKLSSKNNLKLLINIKNIIENKAVKFYAELFKDFGIESYKEVSEIWVETMLRINKMLHKAITVQDFISDDELRMKLVFYEKFFGKLIGEEGMVKFSEKMIDYVSCSRTLVEVKK